MLAHGYYQDTEFAIALLSKGDENSVKRRVYIAKTTLCSASNLLPVSPCFSDPSTSDEAEASTISPLYIVVSTKVSVAGKSNETTLYTTILTTNPKSQSKVYRFLMPCEIFRPGSWPSPPLDLMESASPAN